jgi:hypothetical protein
VKKAEKQIPDWQYKLDQLRAPFPADAVQWRVGATNWKAVKDGKTQQKKGQALAYIDMRDVIQRLTDVMGIWWASDQIPMPNGTQCCRISLSFDEGKTWIGRTDGAGPTGDIADEKKREMAVKGGYSDSFKRAGVQWGIGEYLYHLDSPWIALNEWWGIPDEVRNGELRRVLTGQKEPTSSAQRKDGGDQAFQGVIQGLRAAKKHGEKAVKAYWQDPTTQKTLKGFSKSWLNAIVEEKNTILKDLRGEPEPGAYEDDEEEVAL